MLPFSGKWRRLWAIAAVLGISGVSGCRSFSKIESDLCGNGVIEPGEDCEPALADDGSCGASGESACRFVCDEETLCPDQWLCGVDKLCRQGDGGFELFSQLYESGDRVFAADFDGDGYVDFGFSNPDILRFRFGPDLTFRYSQPIAASRGIGAVDVNEDGKSDGFVAEEDNWSILLGTDASRIDSSLHPSGGFGVSRHRLGVAPFSASAFGFLSVPFAIAAGESCGGGEHACIRMFASGSVKDLGFPFAEYTGPANATAIGAIDSNTLDVRIAAARRGSSEVFLYPVECGESCRPESMVVGEPATVELVPGGPLRDGETSFSSPAVAQGGVHFADADGDGDDDVLVWTRDAGGNPGLGVLYNQGTEGDPLVRRLVGTCEQELCSSQGNDHCADDLSIHRYATSFASINGGAPGDLLAVGQIDGRGFVDLVTSTGIFLAAGTGSQCQFASDFSFNSQGWVPQTAPWSRAAVGDINGDGLDDVAAASDDSAQIEIYRGDKNGALNRVVFDTEVPPRALAIGDLDADGNDDIVFAIPIPAEDSAEIRVLWGSSIGTFVGAEVIGRSFPVHSGSLALAPSVTGLGVFDGDDELFIATNSNEVDGELGNSTLTIVRGSANRALSSPILNQVSTLETSYSLVGNVPVSGELSSGTFAGRAWCVGTLAAGHFFSGSGSLDIATLGELVAVPDRSSGGPTNREICEDSRGLRHTILEGRRGAGSGNVDATPPWCEAAQPGDLRLCARSSVMRAIDTNGDEIDELAIVAPMRDDDNGITCALDDVRTTNAVLIGSVRNIDSPAQEECVAAFGPSRVTEISGILRDAEVGLLDSRDGEDLLITTSTGIFLLSGDDDSLSAAAAIEGIPTAGCELLAAHTIVAGCNRAREIITVERCNESLSLAVQSVQWTSDLRAEVRVPLELEAASELDDLGAPQVVVGDVSGDGIEDFLVRIDETSTIFFATTAASLGEGATCFGD